MKPTVTLAETKTPEGGTLALIEHDAHFFLQSDGLPLESSFRHHAAAELGRLAASPLRSARQPRLLFGGLGLGYPLAAAREALPQKRAFFLVAEPLPDLASWHRKYLESLHPGQLDDPRVTLQSQSLAAALKKPGDGFHAIVLDAEASIPLAGITSRKTLPHSSFLNRAHSALREGGLLALRCSVDKSTVERRLQQAGFEVAHEFVPLSHKGKQKQSSTIWLARKGSYQSHAHQPPNLSNQ